jgi:hypothetical protein
MASSLEVLNAANIQFLRNTPLFIASQTGAQSLANGAFTAITWPTPTDDTYTGWSAGSPTKYTAKVAGTYLVIGAIGFAANATGGRIVQLTKNGVGNVVSQSAVTNAGAGFNCVTQVTAMVAFNGSTDYVELYSDQNSGGALNSIVGVTYMMIQWIHV